MVRLSGTRSFDDEAKFAADWAVDLKVAADREDVSALSEDEFQEAIDRLVDRQRAFTGDAPEKKNQWGECAFDTADVLVVDYELLKLRENATLTGANVAYLARAFSEVKVIVTLNRFNRLYGSKPVFDLDLTGHPNSNASVELQADNLKNRALWSARGEPAFRPSYWPRIDTLITQMPGRVEEVLQNLERPVLEFLGLEPDLSRLLPRSILGLISDKKPEETTLKEFAFRCVGRKAEEVHLRPKQLSRIVAARLGRWLESAVLPLQDILVDLPHLVERFPSLQPAGVELDKLIDVGPKSDKLIETSWPASSHRYLRNEWVSRPVFLWPALQEDRSIDEVREPWSAQHAKRPVFCEDTSCFLDKASTQAFATGLESSYPRRRVAAETTELGRTLRESVVYRPAIRFLQ